MTVARVAPYTAPAQDWQVLLQGLAMGSGSPYGLRGLEGLDLPATRDADTDRSGGDGAFGGRDTAAKRNLVFHFLVAPRQGMGDAAMVLLMRALNAAFARTQVDVPLTMQIPGWGQLLVLGRPRRAGYVYDPAGVTKVQDNVLAQFVGMDPLIYSLAVQDAVLPYPTAGVNAGLPFNTALYRGATARPGPSPSGSTYQGFTFGAIGGGAGASGFATLTNNGTAPTAPVSTIYGPAVGPLVLEKIATGEVIQINLNLSTGDSLELDHDLHSVFLNGSTNWQAAVDASTQWWLLPPGPSLIHYRTVGASPGSSADVKWRDAWW